MTRFFIAISIISLFFINCASGSGKTGKIASKPLYRDPVYDGAADPTIIWNQKEKKWFMFYTNRRANVKGLKGVTWVHGTRIGIAESSDGGATWHYRGTCNIPSPYTETQWAPDVIEYRGIYHMYLAYVPGIFNDWNHPRHIIHFTSKNLIDWKYQSTLHLASNRVIDPTVIRLPDGNWRMWYNNETDHKSMYYADSKDLDHWVDKGKAVGDQPGEGPKVFKWKNKYWMLTDVWDGLAEYESEDLISWKRIPGNLLQKPGTGKDDNAKGHHCDVVVNNGRAYLFYFTHPGRNDTASAGNPYDRRRSSIQVVELEYKAGRLICNRNKPTYIDLQPPKIIAKSTGIKTGLYLVVPKDSCTEQNDTYKIAYLPDSLCLNKEPVITATDIENCFTDSTILDGKEAFVLNIKLKKSAADKFAKITAKNVGKKMAMVIDKKVVMAAIIRDPITSGRLTVSGESGTVIKELGIKLKKEIVGSEK